MENRFRLSPGFCLFGALCLLLLPFSWLMGAMTAALIHELFHCLAVWLCGGQVESISLGMLGARIGTNYLPPGFALVCALAGPLGSFSLLVLAEVFPEASICGLIQGVYNLIPVFPLDGGRALRCILPDAAYNAVEAFFLTALTGLSVWVGTYQPELGLVLLLSLWYPLIQRKISCKEGNLAVQ